MFPNELKVIPHYTVECGCEIFIIRRASRGRSRFPSTGARALKEEGVSTGNSGDNCRTLWNTDPILRRGDQPHGFFLAQQIDSLGEKDIEKWRPSRAGMGYLSHRSN